MYFYIYKNYKRTNSKFNKVFATRQHFDVKFGTVFFFSDKLGNIRQDQTIFFSTKSVSDEKIRDFRISDRGAPRIRQRRGHNRGCGGEAVLSFSSLPSYPPVTFTASHIIIPITYYYIYTPSYSNRIIVNIS